MIYNDIIYSIYIIVYIMLYMYVMTYSVYMRCIAMIRKLLAYMHIWLCVINEQDMQMLYQLSVDVI